MNEKYVKSNAKKAALLGSPYGTAVAKLRKALLFKFAESLGLCSCFRCGYLIDTIEEFSIEHKVAWAGAINPRDAFFDLNNIAFSHLRCNVGAGNKDWMRAQAKHPSSAAYIRGCRCDECRNVEKLRRREQRERGIAT